MAGGRRVRLGGSPGQVDPIWPCVVTLGDYVTSPIWRSVRSHRRPTGPALRPRSAPFGPDPPQGEPGSRRTHRGPV
jgi:hypothetical protein